MSNHIRLPAVRSQVKNRILLSLPEHEFQRIFPHFTCVALRLGQVLYNSDGWIDYAYFLNTGMTSLLAVTDEGETVEVGTVGSEGVMGVQVALGKDRAFYSGVVQIPGNAMRIRAETLSYEFRHNAEFSRLLLNYMLDLRLQANQFVICNRSHSLEQRLCRWLLTSQDCAQSNRFPVTQEFLSHIVGASRAPVTEATQALQEAGLISHRRSYVRIIDHKGMETRACECYRDRSGASEGRAA
jgi:CRP-like cAMP-binding protein